MLIGGLSKGVLGASVAAGTGVGLGSYALASRGSDNSPKIEKVSQNSETPPAPKRCKLYKIESSNTGQVTRTNEEEMEKELKSNAEYYQQIKNACDKEGDVFLSKKDKQAGRYYDEDQNHSTVKSYLQNHPELKH